MKYEPTSVEDKCSEFRALINSVEHERNKLFKVPKKWLIICSAMDVIDDTEQAIKYFTETKGEIKPGKAYLYAYGLLQTLYVQQDAVYNLRSSLNTPKFNDEEISRLNKIREIRNDAVGHPTKRDQNDIIHRSTFLNRHSMDLESFSLIRSYYDREIGDESIRVNLKELIKIQREIIASLLNNIIDALKNRVNKHRRKFMQKRMQDCFPGTIRYHLSKIAESKRLGRKISAQTDYNWVKKSIREFREQIHKRSLEGILGGVELVLRETERPIEVLDSFFSDSMELSDQDLEIYVYYLDGKVRELVEMAIEIDEDYSERL